MTNTPTQLFIATIDADRDQKFARIRSDTDAEIHQTLSEAYERSRQLHYDTNKRLRSELSSRRHKETSRTQGRLRRQLWQRLTQLQHDIKQQVLDRLLLAWAEPDWQRAWCEFWLGDAQGREGCTTIRVVIDRSAVSETLEFIRQWSGQNGLELELDASLNEAGLMVFWQDFELDGRLSAQGPTIEDEVLARLAPMMPQLQQVDTL